MAKLKMFHNRHVVEWAKLYLLDNYPDLHVPEYMIEAVFLGVLDYIKAGIEAESDLTIPSLGKFSVKKKENRKGDMQYYIKFKVSRHLVLNLRQSKGTLTEAEKRDIAKREAFIQGMWDKKQARLAAVEAKKQEKLARQKHIAPTISELRQTWQTAKEIKKSKEL